MIEAAYQNDALVIKILLEELEMYKIPQLKAAVISQLDPQPKKVILDMEKVEMIDSSAIGALFYFNKTIKGYGGKMMLVSLGEQADAILHATQSMGLLSVCTSTEEALGGTTPHQA